MSFSVNQKISYLGNEYIVVDVHDKFITVRPLSSDSVGGEIWFDYFDKVKVVE